MAFPDLTNPTSVKGKNSKLAVNTTAQTLVQCATGSNKTMRVVSLYVSNVNGSNAASVTVAVNDGVYSRRICNTVAVPADSTLSVITREDVVYLMEGDTLEIYASQDNMLEAIASYEEIS